MGKKEGIETLPWVWGMWIQGPSVGFLTGHCLHKQQLRGVEQMEWADLKEGTNHFPKQPFLQLTVWLLYILVFLDCVVRTKILG